MESSGHWRDWAGDTDGPLISIQENRKDYLDGEKNSDSVG